MSLPNYQRNNGFQLKINGNEDAGEGEGESESEDAGKPVRMRPRVLTTVMTMIVLREKSDYLEDIVIDSG